MLLMMTAIVGFVLGRFAAGWAAAMLYDMNSGGLLQCSSCGKPVSTWARWIHPVPLRCPCEVEASRRITWPLASAVCLSILFAAFAYLLISLQCQSVDEVRPSMPLTWTRLPFHLSLIFLLWTATLTDLLDYVIPDIVIKLGIGIALLGAVGTGELQTIHFWVNWDHVIEGVQGPYLPEWMKHYQRLHGLVWSLTGLVVGGLITWVVRGLSGWILQQPALGLGDVTLMAMIGAYIGWQPTLCVLAMAPLMSVFGGLFVRVVIGRGFVAYGPYLAFSAIAVICTWRWLWADWLELRIIFSHLPSVVGLVVAALATLAILLGLLRLFRAVPVERVRR